MPETEVLGTGIGLDAEASQVYEEGRSILGSLITRLIAIAHSIIHYAISLGKTIIYYASEHPLALTLLVANVCIWMS
jgi:hypothetical protein